jgi:hypothetical protein
MRKGLLRFILEGEGYDVVGEATSTMELAQTLAVHRPDVVVLDSGIDASAIGVTHELLPDAKIVLVWPAAVAPIGADASVDPLEVMTQLGPTVARVMGVAGVITAPHRRPDERTIVVPEAEPEPALPEPAKPEPAQQELPQPEQAQPEPPQAPPLEPFRGPPPEVPREPSREPLEAPRWTYVAMSQVEVDRRRRSWVAAVIAGVAVLLVGVALVLLLTQRDRTIEVASVIGQAPPGFVWPGMDETPSGGIFTGPGIYQGPLRLRASGTIGLAAQGSIRLRTRGTVRLVARGDLRIVGKGAIRNTNGGSIRVHASGTLKVRGRGRIRVRVTGTVRMRTDGAVRVSGNGSINVRTQAG